MPVSREVAMTSTMSKGSKSFTAAYFIMKMDRTKSSTTQAAITTNLDLLFICN